MQSDYYRALEAGDSKELRRLWSHSHSHLPQVSEKEAEKMLHLARCGTGTLPLKLRAYSHRWLVERNIPSPLPDEIRPECERLYPRIADSVALCFRASNPAFKEVAAYAQHKASLAVEEMWAENDKDPLRVRNRIKEVKLQSEREMLGHYTLRKVT